MKSEELIKQNLFQKIAGLKCGYGGETIKEHIKMLDWVLMEGNIRTIDDIIDYWEGDNGRN